MILFTRRLGLINIFWILPFLLGKLASWAYAQLTEFGLVQPYTGPRQAFVLASWYKRYRVGLLDHKVEQTPDGREPLSLKLRKRGIKVYCRDIEHAGWFSELVNHPVWLVKYRSDVSPRTNIACYHRCRFMPKQPRVDVELFEFGSMKGCEEVHCRGLKHVVGFTNT